MVREAWLICRLLILLISSHFEIIKALVEAGADIQMPNHFGGTCLINSVQSPELVGYLIK